MATLSLVSYKLIVQIILIRRLPKNHQKKLFILMPLEDSFLIQLTSNFVITQQTMQPLKSTNDHILMVISKIFWTHFTYKLQPEYFINS